MMLYRITLFIVELNSDFRHFRLWDQKLLFKVCFKNSSGIYLRDFVTIKLERYFLLIFSVLHIVSFLLRLARNNMQKKKKKKKKKTISCISFRL